MLSSHGATCYEGCAPVLPVAAAARRSSQTRHLRQTSELALRHFKPPLIRVADASDAPTVSRLCGSDATAFMKRATVLMSKHGMFFLEPITSSVLEAHMAFDAPGRGKEALHAAREGLRHAFENMGALVVFGRIPVEDKAARLFTRLIGLKSDGIRAREPGGPMVEWFEIRSDSCLPQ